MRLLLIIYRLLFFALYTSRIVAEVYWLRVWRRSDLRSVMLVRRRWAKRVLSGVGVQVSVEGRPPDYPCLMLANHRSYLDPILILRDVDAFPVAKAELANWPMLGKGAQWAGILYVQRNKSHSRALTLKAIADTILIHRFPIILFPEGTTSALPGMLPFKTGALRTAVNYHLPVVPVAICFTDKRDYWIGETTFLQHAWNRFQQKSIAVRLCYGPRLQYSDSAALEQAVRQWIENKLTESNPASDPSVFKHSK